MDGLRPMDLYCLGCGIRTQIPEGAAWPTCPCGSTGYATRPPEDRDPAAPFKGLALPGAAPVSIETAVASLDPAA